VSEEVLAHWGLLRQINKKDKLHPSVEAQRTGFFTLNKINPNVTVM
jgi:hypothetical protein